MPTNSLHPRLFGVVGKYSLMLVLCLPGMTMAEFRPFSSESLKEITSAHAGRPFLLVLWSVDCPPCLKELEGIGRLYPQFMPESLVIISTDGAGNADEAQQVLIRNGLAAAENWRFAGNFPERLRYRIDPDWYGELPRAYFYAANHARTGKSGALNPTLIRQWISVAKQMAEGAQQQSSIPISHRP